MTKRKPWTPAGNPAPGLRTIRQRTAMLDRVRKGFDARMEQLAHDLATGKINLNTWERYMRREVRAMHTASVIVSRGGDPKAITAADRLMLERNIRGQYQYLHRFAEQIQARAVLAQSGQGTMFSEGYIANRARMYGGASKGTFYSSFCYGLLPQTPGDGSTRCLGNCLCSISFAQGKEPGTVEATWLNDGGEHCQDCLDLAAKWNPYIIYLPEGLSAHDWVTWLPRMEAHIEG